jgi:hypothetical protein
MYQANIIKRCPELRQLGSLQYPFPALRRVALDAAARIDGDQLLPDGPGKDGRRGR